MNNNLYLRLGGGQAAKLGLGNKAALLDRAADAGLTVPRGVILLDTAWDQAILAGLMEVDGQRVQVTRPEALLRYLKLPELGGTVAVRSAFSAEDAHDQSMAGYFQSVLHVDPRDPHKFAAALEQVWTSALRQGAGAVETVEMRLPGRLRRDVLIMRMVDAKHAGVAFTQQQYEDDLVNYTTGTADKLVAGAVAGEVLALPKLRGWERRLPGVSQTPWVARLQGLLREVRRWLGPGEWDIEWADDGERCYLIQVRPITSPPRRNEVFTIANHKEILPPLPSTLMTSVIESCAPDLFSYYLGFDKSLPSDRPFIEVFKGRPYINLSLMSEMMRIFGLPTRLVTDNIGGEVDSTYGLNLRRVTDKSLRMNLPRFALAQVLSVRSAARATREMESRVQNPGGSYSELIETMRWLYTRLVTEMFSLTAAIGPMLMLLRRVNVIEEHNARQQTVSTRMYTDLEPMRQIAAKDESVRASLLAGQVPDHAAFQRLWNAYLDTYGHRGVYESDVSRPRYREMPEPLLQTIAQPAPTHQRSLSRSLMGMLTGPLWWQASRTIKAREQWRHDAMRGFDVVRRSLLARARKDTERGLLPEPEAIWLLTLDELRRLDQGWTPEPDFFEMRRGMREDLLRYHMPDLLHRMDDLEVFREGARAVDAAEQLKGISLTNGTVSGRAWVLAEPEFTLPPGYKPEQTILVARAVDAGWIPTFSRVAGVVVETGGDLSHGSIILREIGIPAITNVSGATRHFRNGDMLELRAGVGVVQRTAAEPVAAPAAPPVTETEAERV